MVMASADDELRRSWDFRHPLQQLHNASCKLFMGFEGEASRVGCCDEVDVGPVLHAGAEDVLLRCEFARGPGVAFRSLQQRGSRIHRQKKTAQRWIVGTL